MVFILGLLIPTLLWYLLWFFIISDHDNKMDNRYNKPYR